jgi:hypothetical protein
MDLVNVYGAKAATPWTVAMKDFIDLPVEHIWRHFLGNTENVSVGEAFLIAETLRAGTHATDNYS